MLSVRRFCYPGPAAVCLAVVLWLWGSPADGDDEAPPAASARRVSVSSLRETIHRAMTMPGGTGLQDTVEGPVILWIERAFVGVNIAYGHEGERYAQFVLRIGNGTQQPLTISRDSMVLQAGGQSLTVGRRRGFMLPPFDRRHPGRSFPSMPLEVTIPPGETTAVGLLFIGLNPSPPIPPMTLRFVSQGGTALELDVNRQMNARLGAATRFVGPQQAAVVLTVHGELNSVNTELLKSLLQEAADRGTQRAVVEWGPTAPAADDNLIYWLVNSTSQTGRRNPLFAQLPPLPGFRQIVVASLPEQNREVLDMEELRAQVFPRTSQAVAAVLSEILPRLRPDLLLRELKQGDPASQLAVLHVAAGQLGPAAWPTILSLTQSSDPDVRSAAIMALSTQEMAERDGRLGMILNSGHSADAEAALAGLLKSARPESFPLVDEALRHENFPVPRQRVIDLLIQYYHPHWNLYLTDCIRHPDPQVRRSGLAALRQLGNRDLGALCTASLNDPDREVRETAFQILIDRHGESELQSALQYAMQRLHAGEVSDAILNLIERLKETRAAPVLLELIRQPHPRRTKMIEVLGEIGSDDDVRTLMSMFSQYSPQEQAAAIRLSSRTGIRQQLDVVRLAADSREPQVRQAALDILKHLRNEESLEIMESFAGNSESDEFNVVCDTLGEIATPGSLNVLQRLRAEARESGDDHRLAQIRRGIRLWMQRSPAWNFLQIGSHHSESKEWSRAIAAYSLAIEIDPNLELAYMLKGNSHLHTSEYEQAGKDFQRALELDPDDPDAITGIAIVWAITGEWERGVEFVENHQKNSREDENPVQRRLFAYNTACVYGRSIEYLEKQPPEERRDASISRLQAKAVENLTLSIDLGFDEYDHMRNDPDLTSLHGLPAFEGLFHHRL